MNFTRFSTLYIKECVRFVKVYNQTIISPIVIGGLYFVIFGIAFAKRISLEHIDYELIVASGLVIMTMLQNSYANTQGTISMAKVLGYMTDYTITPLTAVEFIMAFICAAVSRAIVIGTLMFILLTPIDIHAIHSIFSILFFSVIGCVIFSLFGIMIGCVAATFDSAHAYTSYVVTPLTFLSGTFYSVSMLPSFWQHLIYANPVFYIIDGFRYGITGYSDTNILFSSLFLLTITIILAICTAIVFQKKIKL